MPKENKRLIREVRQNHKNNQKYVTIPKSSVIKEGDYVELIVIKLPRRK
jgi:hypothetical protein